MAIWSGLSHPSHKVISAFCFARVVLLFSFVLWSAHDFIFALLWIEENFLSITRHPWKGSIAPVAPVANIVAVMLTYYANRTKVIEALTKGLLESVLKGNGCRANVEQLQPSWFSSTAVEQPKFLFLSLPSIQLCFHSVTNGKYASVSRFGGLNCISFFSVYHLRKLPFLPKELRYFFLSRTKPSFCGSWQRGAVAVCPFQAKLLTPSQVDFGTPESRLITANLHGLHEAIVQLWISEVFIFPNWWQYVDQKNPYSLIVYTSYHWAVCVGLVWAEICL